MSCSDAAVLFPLVILYYSGSVSSNITIYRGLILTDTVFVQNDEGGYDEIKVFIFLTIFLILQQLVVIFHLYIKV